MKDLKICVANEAESKEAQELLDILGYSKGAFENKSTPCWIAICDGLTYSDYNIGKSVWYTACPKEITLQELRDMVNQDQDEPFLTPETTLNDQYAEIEQVRQSAYDKQEGGSHYKKLAIQPMQYALTNKLDYAQANVVKYVTRHADKNGKEDLLKAIHNIELMIEHYYGVEK